MCSNHRHLIYIYIRLNIISLIYTWRLVLHSIHLSADYHDSTLHCLFFLHLRQPSKLYAAQLVAGSIYGIIFLGTPHAGSDLSKVGQQMSQEPWSKWRKLYLPRHTLATISSASAWLRPNRFIISLYKYMFTRFFGMGCHSHHSSWWSCERSCSSLCDESR